MPKHERALILALLLTWQVGSAATLWAAASQSLVTVPSHRAIVTGIYGEVLIHAGQGGSRLNFHDGVKDGEWLTTGPRSGVELLVGKQAFVTLGEHATLQFLDSPPDRTAIRVTQGEVRLAVARGGEAVTLHTPSVSTITWGGLAYVTVPATQGASIPSLKTGADAFPASVKSPAGSGQSIPEESVHVLEGRFELRSVMGGGRVVTLEAGQRMQLQNGQLSQPVTSALARQDERSLPAVDRHARTPEVAVRHLVRQQSMLAQAVQESLLKSMGLEVSVPHDIATGVILSTTGAMLPSFASQPVPSQPIATSQPPSPIISTTGIPASQPPSPIISTTGIPASQLPEPSVESPSSRGKGKNK
jgi:hypothetical protein